MAAHNSLWASIFILTALVGCAPSRPFHEIAVNPGARFLPTSMEQTRKSTPSGAGQRWRTDQDLEASWWLRFGSDALSEFESEALAANSDLKAAMASVRVAQNLYKAQAAALAPNLQLAIGGNRARTSGEIASPLSSNALSYTLYSTQLSATLPVDVTGGLRAQSQAAKAQAEAQQCLALAAKLNLTASVAQTFILIAGLNSQRDDAIAAATAARRALSVTMAMKAAGEASDADRVAAESTLAGLEQVTPTLDRQIRVATDLLAVLTGRRPEDMSAPQARLSELTLPADLPISVPSETLRRRPDVCAAEAGVRAAAALREAAIAARLPSFTISAVGGGQSTQIPKLLSNSNILWAIGANASETVFDGGALKHRAGAADAALDQAIAQHRSVVLGALQSVGDSLQATQSDADLYTHLDEAARAAVRSQQILEAQHTLGQSGELSVLNAQIAERQADLALSQVILTRQLDTVLLFAAVGGGLTTTTRVVGDHAE